MATCIEHLSCPVCSSALGDLGDRAACENAHSFDFARSGYLNLTQSGPRPRMGDSKEMVQARAEFLAGGFMEGVADAVARATRLTGVPETIVEIGSGTGYYLNRARAGPAELAEQPRCALGIDLSVAAATHAARALPTMRFVVADAELRLPLLDRSADALISVFAPRPAAECARVAVPGATLVAAFATERHLRALRERYGLLSVHPDKLRQLSARLAPWFELSGTETVEKPVALGPEDVANAIGMGPSARHKVSDAPLEPVADRVSVTVARFVRRRDG